MDKLSKAKEIIKENFADARCGIYDCRSLSLLPDIVECLYNEDGLRIDICYEWEYFEVFGLTAEEFRKLKEYYYVVEGN